MAVSISELAQMANTSVATVSRALSGKPGVSAERREAIRLLADRVGYRPNQLARNLLAQRTNTLGFVTANLANGTHVELLQLLETAARDRGYEMLVADSRRSVERECANIEAFQRHRVDGLIVLPVWELDRGVDQRHLLDLYARNVPVVVACDMADYGFPTVASDEGAAGAEVARHLIDFGHRHLLVVGGDETKQLSRARLAGITEAVAEYGSLTGNDCSVSTLPFDFDHATTNGDQDEKLRAVFGRSVRPTAVVALYSHLGLRLLRPFSRIGVRVPDGVSMVVFDDSDWCCWGVPAMTAVASRGQRLATSILDELCRRIEHPELPPNHTRVPQRLIGRESVIPAGDIHAPS